MIEWILVTGGMLAALLGVTVAVSVTTHNKRELGRLVSQRLRGFTTASRILSSQERTIESANLLATLGVLVTGFGLAASFRGLPLALSAVVGLVLALPLAVTFIFAIPRSVGRRWPDLFAHAPARWVDATVGVLVRVAVHPSDADRQGQLLDTLRVGGEEELYEPQELAIISGVLSFGRLPVRTVMTPRRKLVAVAAGLPMSEVARVFNESGFSRLPVYGDSLDDVTGMVYAFDLLKVPPGGQLPLRPVSAFPETRACSDVLLEMQRDRRHIAIVLDEFGGVAGVVTMDDLLKELVRRLFGDLQEGARPPAGSVRVDFDATVATELVADHFGVKLGDPNEVIGALLVRAAGRIPAVGERFNLGGLEVEVLAATASRLKLLGFRKGPVPVEDLVLGQDQR